MTYDNAYWIENFEAIGKREGYQDETIKLYGDVIKLFSDYDLLEKNEGELDYE